MELESEVHAHPQKVGHSRIDLLLASSALVLSIASIVISMQNESNMRRLVTANSWPYVSLYHGDLTANGEAAIHFDAKNAGIGPATVEKLSLTYDGKPVRSVTELLQACCASAGGAAAVHRLAVDVVVNKVLSPREDTIFLSVAKSDADAALWNKLDAERLKIGMSVCYSSVFDERWVTSLGKPGARSVKSCDELPGPAYDDMKMD